MMKSPLLLLLFVLIGTFSPARAQTGGEPPRSPAYRFALDLTRVREDTLEVSLLTPEMKAGAAVYNIPKVIPGTYSVSNYGRFVSDFRAFDQGDTPLTVKKLDDNRWEILTAEKLRRVSYRVNDTWDTPKIALRSAIFEPGGTSFEEKVFVLNPFALFGYFDGLRDRAFEVTVTKPREFFGATALVDQDTSELTDRFQTKNYQELADSPMLYHVPDTTTVTIGETEFLVSVYSPNKKVSSKTVAEKLRPVLNVQKAYLGGTLPVKKYAFLFYLSDDTDLQAVGALEHSCSSLYFMPEFAPEAYLMEAITDAAAHEVFHILTPLSVHSEEVGDFDYITPRMSKHLWLYEGLTEYASHHARLKGGLIDLETYMDSQMEKARDSEQYNDKIAFTEMSANILDKYKDQFPNVYAKGALIGLCLDVRLRQLSGGKYGTQNLLKDLSRKYGKDKSFKDDALFAEITAMTYPEIGTFLEKYVAGTDPLPLRETLDAIGVEYTASRFVSQFRPFYGLRFNEEGAVVLGSAGETAPPAITKLGQSLGLKAGDEIVSVNDRTMSRETVSLILRRIQSWKEGDPLKVVVSRKNDKGEKESITLTGKAFKEDVEYKHLFNVLDAPADGEKIRMRNAWMK